MMITTMNIQKIKSSRYMQYVSSIVATLSVASCGMAGSWASPSLPLLQSHNSPIGRPVSDEEGSWIISTYALTATITPLLSAWALDKFGRKNILLLAAMLALTEWMLIIFAKSYELLITARCIGGVGLGLTVMTCAIYNAEIAEPDIRGKLTVYLSLMKTLGSVIVLTIGPYISYLSLAILSAFFPILFCCLFYFLPESPYYLVKSGDIEGAKKAIIKLSSNKADDQFIDGRVTLIRRTVEADMANKGSALEFFTSKQYAYTIFVLFGIKTLQTFNASVILGSYLQTIIELTDSELSPEVTSMIVGSIELPVVYFASLLVDRVGRKPLLIISAIGSAIALFGEGTYFYIQDYLESNTSSLGWLPTAGVVLFSIMHPLGVKTLPYVLLGELFPTNIKAIAVATATTYGALISFLVSKFFKPLSNIIGIYTVFYIFTGTCIAGAIFVYVFLPETKGKNFNEIQIQLKNKTVCRSKVENKELN